MYTEAPWIYRRQNEDGSYYGDHYKWRLMRSNAIPEQGIVGRDDDFKRFYDFYIPSHNTLIEIDGDYWHGNMDIYEAKDLKGFQKRAHNVDDMKNKWAAIHGMILIRIWEHEIRKSPESVMLMLKKQLLGGNIKKNKNNRNSRNVNKLNIL